MPGLPPPPDSVVSMGAPVHGRFAGMLPRIDWSALRPPHRRGWVWTRLHHKRWHYVGLGNERVFIGVAIVDVGWTSTAFAYLFDRRRRRLLADWSQDALPGLASLQARVSDAPLIGAHSRFRSPNASLALQHQPDGSLRLHVSTRALHIEAQLDLADMAPPLLAIGPIDGGVAHATQKTSALPVRGWAEVEGQRFLLDDAWGAVDASNGLLAHDTAWRWASAHRADLGFNLQQGYFGAQENALWLDGRLVPLGIAHFEFDAKRPMDRWRVWTEDGLLNLRFTPEGARAADRNYGFAASQYVQPVGTFDGTVRARIDAPPRDVRALLGITEDHRSRW